jgi:hypothetical protein
MPSHESLVLSVNNTIHKSFADPDPKVYWPPGSGFVSTRSEFGSSSGVRILLSSSKNSKRNLDSYSYLTSLWFFIFEK